MGGILGFVFTYFLIPGPPATVSPSSGNRTFAFAEGGCVGVEFALSPSIEGQNLPFSNSCKIKISRGSLVAAVAGLCQRSVFLRLTEAFEF